MLCGEPSSQGFQRRTVFVFPGGSLLCISTGKCVPGYKFSCALFGIPLYSVAPFLVPCIALSPLVASCSFFSWVVLLLFELTMGSVSASRFSVVRILFHVAWRPLFVLCFQFDRLFVVRLTSVSGGFLC